MNHFDSIIGIDFESYYAKGYSLGKGKGKFTTSQYVHSPLFQTIGVGVRLPDGTLLWMEDAEFRQWALTIDWTRTAVLAHHAHFDGLILSHHYGIIPAFWFDTLSISRAIFGTEVGGSLSKLMLHFGVGEKGTEVVAAFGKRREDFTQEEWLQYGEYCKNDIRGTWDILIKFCEQYDYPESELWHIDTTIRMFTEPVLLLHEERMRELLLEEQTRKQNILESLGMTDKKQLRSAPKFAMLLMQLGVDPPQKYSLKQEKMVWSFGKTDPGFQQLLDHENEDVCALVAAKLDISSNINESRTQRLLTLGEGGRPMCVYLNYAGAHTIRWSGGDGTNFQNMEKTNKKNLKKGRIRKAILAPPRWKIVVADSGAIEARGTAWMAGQDDVVEMFAKGKDLYSAFATKAYRRPIDRKKNPADEIPGFVGKTCTLGLQYGMGAIKLAVSLAAGANGGPPVFFTSKDAEGMGVDVQNVVDNDWLMEQIQEMPSRLPIDDRVVHVAVCDDLVKTYRRENHKIVELWDDMGEVLAMIAHGEEGELMNGLLHVKKDQIMFPNGLPLQFPDMKEAVFEGKNGKLKYEYTYRQKKSRSYIYGAKLLENVMQRLCRDIIAEQMHEFRMWGAKIATTTHDEVVGVVPEEIAQEALDVLLKIMKTTPSWCPGLPLNAEGGFGDVYGEVK